MSSQQNRNYYRNFKQRGINIGSQLWMCWRTGAEKREAEITQRLEMAESRYHPKVERTKEKRWCRPESTLVLLLRLLVTYGSTALVGASFTKPGSWTPTTVPVTDAAVAARAKVRVQESCATEAAEAPQLPLLLKSNSLSTNPHSPTGLLLQWLPKTSVSRSRKILAWLLPSTYFPVFPSVSLISRT